MAINLVHTSGEKLFSYEGSLNKLIMSMVVFIFVVLG